MIGEASMVRHTANSRAERAGAPRVLSGASHKLEKAPRGDQDPAPKSCRSPCQGGNGREQLGIEDQLLSSVLPQAQDYFPRVDRAGPRVDRKQTFFEGLAAAGAAEEQTKLQTFSGGPSFVFPG